MFICIAIIAVGTKTSYANNLPNNIRLIPINNWTKTREVYEVDEDTKLNSELDFTNHNNTIHNLNINSINQLINSANEIRDKATVEGLEDKVIEGGKVLRTRDIIGNQSYKYNLTTNVIRSWLSSSQAISWELDDNNTYTTNWNHEYNHKESKKYAIEWRLLQGEFNLSEVDYNSIINEEKDIVLGLKTIDGFEMILPFQEIVNVLINGKSTGMNYTTLSGNNQIRINNNKINYQKPRYNIVSPINDEYCKENHKSLSSHVLNQHAHLNKRNSIPDEVSGDISSYIQKGVNEIDILVGQKYDRSNTYDGGISKLDAFLIEKANSDIKFKFYKIDESTNKKIYINKEDVLHIGEKIYYEVEIINDSNEVDISYPNITTNLKSGISNRQVIKINPDKITLTENNISKNIDEFNVEIIDSLGKSNMSNLSDKLNPQSRMIISSNEFNYKIQDNDLNNKKITSMTDFGYRYADNNLSGYIEDEYNQFLVDEEPITNGSIRINIQTEGLHDKLHEGVYIQIKDLKNSCTYNINIDEVDSYQIDELDLDDEYEMKLILPSYYKLKNSSEEMINNKITIILNKDNPNKQIDIILEDNTSTYFKDTDRLNIDFIKGSA